MSRTRIHNKTKNRFKRAIRDVVSNLGRKVKVYKQIKRSECPNCFYDKATDSSTGRCKWRTPLEAHNKQVDYEADTGNTDLRYKYFKTGRCPICKNVGYLVAYKRYWVECLINWDPDTNDIIHTQAGKGSSTLVLLKTDPKHLNLFIDSISIEIDGISCVLESPPTLRGLGNQTILVVKAIADSKLKKNSREKLKDYT